MEEVSGTPSVPGVGVFGYPSSDDLIDLLNEVRDSLIWHASNAPLSRRDHGPVLAKIDMMIERLTLDH